MPSEIQRGMIQEQMRLMTDIVNDIVFQVHVFGNPIPQPRHRVGRHGAYIKDDHPIHAWRQAIRAAVKRERGKQDPIEGPLGMGFKFIIQRPESHWKKDGTLRRGKPLWPTLHGTGDMDNLIKPVKDMLEKFGVFLDDSQVCYYLPTVKLYARRNEAQHATLTLFHLNQTPPQL